jgi:hypothetical protein
MPAARYPSDRFDGTGGAAENEAIARIRGTGAGLIDQVISASCKPAAHLGTQKVLQKIGPPSAWVHTVTGVDAATADVGKTGPARGTGAAPGFWPGQDASALS